MNEILVYKDEATDGLLDKIRQNTTIAYCAPLEKRGETNLDLALKIEQSVANTFPGSSFGDLYPTKSVFVTTNWNKNDDVFDPQATWAARKTPSHKPTNIEHDEHRLVGHMTDSWVIDEDGKVIPDSTSASDLPDVFHLCNGAVIYTSWEDQELVDRTQKLIAEIEAGTKFVSMEVLFTSFDYAVVDPDGSSFTVARDDSSAFLTKHLRCYGGTGEFEGRKVGRLLKNLNFSGKGYVDKPANPESVIFSSGSTFDFSNASQENPFITNSGVYLKQRQLVAAHNNEGDNDMSENVLTDALQSQLDEAKAANKSLKDEFKTLTDKLAQADVATFESKIGKLEEALASATTKIEETEAKLSEANQKAVDVQSELAEAVKAQDEAEAKIAKAEAEALTASRISSLVDGGLDKTDAETKVETFSNLNDEQFSTLAAELVKVVSKNEDSDEEATEEDAEASDESSDEAEANATEEVLENAEASDDEVDGAVGSDDEEVESATASLVQFLGERKSRN